MGILRALRLSKAATSDAPSFVVEPENIPAEIFGIESYTDPVAVVARVNRRTAMQCPAVVKSRNLIAGGIGGLPLATVGPDKQPGSDELLQQPERNVARSVTMTNTVEDLVFEGVAFWQVTEFSWTTYPKYVKRVHPSRVSPDKEKDGWRVDGKFVPAGEMVQFLSPNDPLLVAGARAIRTCLKLDAAAAMYADSPRPLGYFSPAEGADPAEDEDISQLLTDWHTGRKVNADGYVPAALKYTVTQFSPEQLQLADARQHAVLEIARVAGIDPEELGVSTTSRTYFNAQDRNKAFLDFTLGMYLRAIEDRLSMGDVTPRGYVVRFNLNAFLRTDTATRYGSYSTALDKGFLTIAEVRELEDLPPLSQETAVPVAASNEQIAETFDQPKVEHTLDAAADSTFSVDLNKRTIRGLAVPYGKTAKSKGKSWQFSKGTLKFSDVTRVKLLVAHDWAKAVGYAAQLDETDAGLMATFKVVDRPAGDEALLMADGKVWDGLSVGIAEGGTYENRNGVFFATSAPLGEISLTPCPAYDDARVTEVAASAQHEGTTAMKCEKCGLVHAEGVVECNKITEPANFSKDDLKSAVAEALAEMSKPGEGRETVAPVTFEVNEPLPYRFDGGQSDHDFSTDLISGLKGDGESYDRVLKFAQDAFAPKFNVATTNTVELNPTLPRPDLYVDERKFATPFYSALFKGTLQNITPFVFPKFNSASGLVADHVEGTEPTPGAFDMTSQTVTPSAVSGKVVINREVWDQGGNPQVSKLIWEKMVYGYYKMLEAKAVAVLDAASPTAIALTAGLADDDLVNQLEGELASLNFLAGGNLFNFAGTQIDLYKKLAAAVDSTGRKLLPIINPTNANGSATSGFKALDVAGTTFVPAWSLAATGSVVASSYLVDTGSVHVWNTPPRQITMDEIKVATVELGIWGYVATAISDLTGVREITYDPVA